MTDLSWIYARTTPELFCFAMVATVLITIIAVCVVVYMLKKK